MCGIAGCFDLKNRPIEHLGAKLRGMNELQRHRGPDGNGVWTHKRDFIGFGHQRLSIIDLQSGAQPMQDNAGNWITFNGEIYNYIELREELGKENFTTASDTEVILHAYQKWGVDCVEHLRGMFAFAIWDEKEQRLFCARDRFGIKPFYYMVLNDVFYFSSEIKALLPFVDSIETDTEGLKDYFTFQLCLAGKTLFKNIVELLPGHQLVVNHGTPQVSRYWEVYYETDFDHTAKYFEEKVQQLIFDSVDAHLRSDVPVGSYISGGLDSSIVASLASIRQEPGSFEGYTGKFTEGEEFDESEYARCLADWRGFELKEIDIKYQDFLDTIEKVIYHLDYPIAGPGSFPQYMVSKLASQYRKVVLGGQGGDEIFGGYTRYLIAYFEQCIKAAIDGSIHNGNFIVTYESIIPNLRSLKNYKPMLKHFWSDGLFDDMDHRYFRLVNRSRDLQNEVYWDELNGDYQPFESFRKIFRGDNVKKESYFDSMTHFDFKTLLPALLQVEDRVSMAHGLESRVPFLDHPLIELVATIPSNIKFENGNMKHVLKNSMKSHLPDAIVNRKDKMGFPVPLTDWMQNEIKDFVMDVFSSQNALNRPYINNKQVLQELSNETKFGRKIWGLLCLELWQTQFHDQQKRFKDCIKPKEN